MVLEVVACAALYCLAQGYNVNDLNRFTTIKLADCLYLYLSGLFYVTALKVIRFLPKYCFSTVLSDYTCLI